MSSATPIDYPLLPRGPILVFTATYNERDNIAAFVREVLALRREPTPDIHLLVVDDNSPDGTGELLDALALELPCLHVIHRPRKLGLGSAHKVAMLEALRGGYEALVTMDADFSHSPGEIPALLAQLERADFVIGSRYAPGGRCDYRGYRRLVSQLANRAARLLLGLPLAEATTSFRAFRRCLLEAMSVSALRSQGYSFFLECAWRVVRTGARVAEMPIHFHDRRGGTSKIPKLEIVRGATKLLELVGERLGLLGRRPDAELPGDACGLCGQHLLVEEFPRSGEGVEGVEAYRCTSLGHRSKPPVARCLACGLLSVPGSAIPTRLVESYAEVRDDRYVELEDARRKTFRRAFDSIARHLAARGKMLEVGCYTGLFLEEARARGWSARGIEPSRWAAEIARARGLDVHCGTLDDLPRPDERYDAIVMWDVLEHLADPAKALRQARELLVPGGILCLSTLDIDSWFPRLMGRSWPWYMDMHLFYFSREGLVAHLESEGLRVREVGPYGHYIALPYLCLKAAASLPSVIGWAPRLLSRVLPGLSLRVCLRDIKLFVAERPQVEATRAHRALSPERVESADLIEV